MKGAKAIQVDDFDEALDPGEIAQAKLVLRPHASAIQPVAARKFFSKHGH